MLIEKTADGKRTSHRDEIVSDDELHQRFYDSMSLGSGIDPLMKWDVTRRLYIDVSVIQKNKQDSLTQVENLIMFGRSVGTAFSMESISFGNSV